MCDEARAPEIVTPVSILVLQPFRSDSSLLIRALPHHVAAASVPARRMGTPRVDISSGGVASQLSPNFRNSPSDHAGEIGRSTKLPPRRLDRELRGKLRGRGTPPVVPVSVAEGRREEEGPSSSSWLQTKGVRRTLYRGDVVCGSRPGYSCGILYVCACTEMVIRHAAPPSARPMAKVMQGFPPLNHKIGRGREKKRRGLPGAPQQLGRCLRWPCF